MNKNLLLALGLLINSGAVVADQGTYSYSTGIDYSSGKYGQAEDTNITYIPLTGKYEKDKLTLKLTVPYLRIDGPGGVTPDSRIVVNGNTNNTRTVQSGLGDVVLGATYSVLELAEQKVYVDVGGKIKFPTASESKGLGTGKTDYAVSTDVYKSIGQTTLYGTVGYKVLGDPAGVNLNNVFFGSTGLIYKVDAKNSLGIGMDARERTSANSTALREYSVFYSHKFNQNYKLQTYLVVGDTTSSVDLGGGATLGISW